MERTAPGAEGVGAGAAHQRERSRFLPAVGSAESFHRIEPVIYGSGGQPFGQPVDEPFWAAEPAKWAQ